MSRPVVERLVPGDEGRLRALRLRALTQDPDAFYRTLSEEQGRALDFWTGWLAPDENVVVTCRHDGVDVGLAALVPDRSAPDERAIVAFWVDPAVRGRGVGRALAAHLVEQARAQGVPAVTLEVADVNTTAVRLYDSLGFEPTGEVGAFPPPREHLSEHRRRLVLVPRV